MKYAATFGLGVSFTVLAVLWPPNPDKHDWPLLISCAAASVYFSVVLFDLIYKKDSVEDQQVDEILFIAHLISDANDLATHVEARTKSQHDLFSMAKLLDDRIKDLLVLGGKYDIYVQDRFMGAPFGKAIYEGNLSMLYILWSDLLDFRETLNLRIQQVRSQSESV